MVAHTGFASDSARPGVTKALDTPSQGLPRLGRCDGMTRSGRLLEKVGVNSEEEGPQVRRDIVAQAGTVAGTRAQTNE